MQQVSGVHRLISVVPTLVGSLGCIQWGAHVSLVVGVYLFFCQLRVSPLFCRHCVSLSSLVFCYVSIIRPTGRYTKVAREELVRRWMLRLLGSSRFASFLLRWWVRGWSSDLVCSQIHKASAPPNINKSVPQIHQLLQHSSYPSIMSTTHSQLSPPPLKLHSQQPSQSVFLPFLLHI